MNPENNNIVNLENISKNIFSQNCLSPLINGYPYLPFSDSSVDFHSLQILINDIIIHKRKTILEFGSGMSTVILGRLFKLNKIDAKIYSVDDNSEWISSMENIIKREGLSDYINLIYAPLENVDISEFKDHTLKWYSTKKLTEKLDQVKFDLMFVDGPIAYKPEIERSRYPALPFIKDRFESNFSVFLHDTNRHGEQSIIYDWEDILKSEHIQFTKKLSGFIIGQHFTITVS